MYQPSLTDLCVLLTNLCTVYVVHLVVTNDVENTINNNLLSTLGQNNVLNALFACCKVSSSQVNGNNTILCTVCQVSIAECSLSKANYFVTPITC